MRELVLIIPDFYLGERERHAPRHVPLPALERLLRLARRQSLAGGWRTWLCQRAGRPDLAGLAPAALAAGGLDHAPSQGSQVWLAQAVHLQAGLTRVELAVDGLLRLAPAEAEALARDFRADIGDERLALEPLSGGAFLLRGLETDAITEDPARHLGADIASALPRGAGAAALRRLGGEVELWLHEHPVNRERLRRGAAPVSSLWFWGGGEAFAMPAQRPLPQGFGVDASFAGLWRLCGAGTRPLPADWNALEQEAGAASAVALVEQAEGGLEALERDWIVPAAARLTRGDLAMLALVINDFSFTVRPRDRFRLWRSRRPWPARLT